MTFIIIWVMGCILNWSANQLCVIVAQGIRVLGVWKFAYKLETAIKSDAPSQPMPTFVVL